MPFSPIREPSYGRRLGPLCIRALAGRGSLWAVGVKNTRYATRSWIMNENLTRYSSDYSAPAIRLSHYPRLIVIFIRISSMGHRSQQSAHIGKARQASQPQREPVDKGLLNGIRYERNDAHHSLEQSHNDVQLMKSLLMGEYIFEVYGSRN